MIIRKSTHDDIDRMLDIYEAARQFMRKSGNKTQWVGGYPSESMLLDDIDEGNSYVCLKDEEVVGTFYYIEYLEGDDPTYIKIYDGQWINDKPYGVVHRIASARGTKGVGSFCLEWCFDQLGNLRIDTHSDNLPMQKLLDKLGYTKCGIIYVDDGSERVAYQKIEE